MTAFSFFRRKLGFKFFIVILLSSLSGVISAYFLSIFNNFVVQEDSLTSEQIATFLGLLVATLVLKKVIGNFLIKFVNRVILNLRCSILETMSKTSYASFETFENEKVYSSLVDDAESVSTFPETLIAIVTNFFVVLGCIVYMGTISLSGVAYTFGLILSAALIYLFLTHRVNPFMVKLRNHVDQFYRVVDDFILGYRELKVNKNKHDDFYENDLMHTIKSVFDLKILTGVKFLNTSIVADILIYSVIGIFLVLVSPIIGLTGSLLVSFVIVLFYIFGPIGTLIGTYPSLMEINIALERLLNLQSRLEHSDADKEDTNGIDENTFSSMELKGISYSYAGEEGVNTFGIKDINLKINSGELTFICGGNGSGKTTLMKVITGLYSAKEGTISINGNERNTENSEYRKLFSVVFSDYYLFQKLYGNQKLAESDTINELLAKLQLEKVVSVEDDKYSTINLSQGQKKRLALFGALIESKEIIFLDEFAADQDPEFRKFFYMELLPELKSLGKTIIAITHDDSYFKVADKIIKMNLGEIESVNTEAVSETV